MSGMQALQGKIIVVTGAGAGIGLGIARACVQAGATVLGVSLLAEEVRAVLDVGAEFLQADVGDPVAISRLAAVVKQQFGGLDGLVNNAGVTIEKPFLEMPLDELDLLWRVNQRSVFLVSQMLVPLLRKPGSIVNIGSNHARATLAGYEMYAGTKGAIVSMTRAMAWSLGPLGIRVNALCPGLTRTEKIAALEAGNAQLADHFRQAHATGIYNTVDEIGALAAFLLSDAGQALSGSEIVADQGMSSRLGAF
ncbi:SDR family NAD(P)-dependent oxidoreductase [Rhizobium hainanense]|uniref:3-oxoacyl-[acyl-carrier protein] reductase n=1 Tax=Rhizobium hainanense TaxID=52131 RepID=A0A1C3W8R9_9HYPH|nr:SDR family oxidoreductase [Rhizobium hainanense]SCB36557.1 3-oxoacyl-[acyl-carrier protein] reductase [Rhizobium hainanense]